MFGIAASHPEPEQLRRLGLGQLEDAEARVVEDHVAGCDVCAVTLRKQPSPSVWLLLAMAQHRCQRQDEAKQWLSRARDWIAKARDAKPTGEPDELTWGRLPWTERLALELLQDAAENLITKPSTKP
jgi:hypothetical protein